MFMSVRQTFHRLCIRHQTSVSVFEHKMGPLIQLQMTIFHTAAVWRFFFVENMGDEGSSGTVIIEQTSTSSTAHRLGSGELFCLAQAARPWLYKGDVWDM